MSDLSNTLHATSIITLLLVFKMILTSFLIGDDEKDAHKTAHDSDHKIVPIALIVAWAFVATSESALAQLIFVAIFAASRVFHHGGLVMGIDHVANLMGHLSTLSVLGMVVNGVIGAFHM